MTPNFIAFDDVIKIHTDQITRYGGSIEVRDLGLLQSAMAQPQAAFGGIFLHADVFEMAAAYLFHLVSNHPFVDGNKRTGLATALVFLDVTGFDVDVPDADLFDLVIGVAQSRIEKATIAEFFRRHSSARNP